MVQRRQDFAFATPVIAEGVQTGGNYIRPETTAALLRMGLTALATAGAVRQQKRPTS